MRKYLVFLLVFVSFVSCEMSRNEHLPVDDNYCYMIQNANELGQVLGSYHCYHLVGNYGDTFDEAYSFLLPEIEKLGELIKANAQNSTCDIADSTILRLEKRLCENAPKDNMEFTSVTWYMYSTVWKDYVAYSEFGVIDSDGNLYRFYGPD